MGARQAGGSWARRWSYWLEPKNWLIVTMVGIGWHADGRAGIGWGLLAGLIVLAFITWSVAAGLILLVAAGAPRMLTGYLAFMLASVAVLAAITTVWKISIHCAVASGSVAVLALTYGPPVLAGYALVALLGWSRVALADHTVAQVVAGSVLGAGAAALAYAAVVRLTATAGTGLSR